MNFVNSMEAKKRIGFSFYHIVKRDALSVRSCTQALKHVRTPSRTYICALRPTFVWVKSTFFLVLSIHCWFAIKTAYKNALFISSMSHLLDSQREWGVLSPLLNPALICYWNSGQLSTHSLARLSMLNIVERLVASHQQLWSLGNIEVLYSIVK